MGRFKTKRGGYFKDQVISAVQKAIRRSDEDLAAFWTSELDLNGNGNESWNRLKVGRFFVIFESSVQIMTVEDIGIAQPEAVITICMSRHLLV
jgi:replication-associated recombination protein RarA